MKSQPKPASAPAAVSLAPAHSRPRSWLLFVHQLPPTPSNLRVQTWRRLQQFGAIPLKHAVYVLPDTPNTREDLEWLTTQVKAAGGDAEVFIGAPANRWSDDALVDEFRRSRQEAYAEISRELERALRRIGPRKGTTTTALSSANRTVAGLRHRLSAVERIDFFGSAGRDRATQLLGEFEARVSNRPVRSTNDARATIDLGDFQGRLWLTRPRPGVDRMSSAWLIRRFIDRQARFGFVADRSAVARDAVPFDMFGVDFSHHGDNCTFETLCALFSIRNDGVQRIAAIVHDLDLKEERFGAPEAPTVATLIEGLQLAHPDDETLLEQGMQLFESLYRSFDQSARVRGPRPVAKTKTSTRRKN